MAKNTKRIDVHHHITPKEYVEKLKSIGITESLGVPFPDWTPESSLKFMKKLELGSLLCLLHLPEYVFRITEIFQ
jgi:hypothetical protein